MATQSLQHLNAYFKKIELSFDERDGFSLAPLFSLRDAHTTNRRLLIDRPEAECEKWFSQPVDEFVAAHLKCCSAMSEHEFVEAYGYQTLAVQFALLCCYGFINTAFIKLFQAQKDENWALQLMYTLILDLRQLAIRADVQLARRGRGKPGEMLEKSAEVLMATFRICASDNRASPEDSKKWGMLNLVNQLFKIYFKINKLQLCKPLIRAIEQMPIKDKFPKAQLVTYRYFVGRKAMFESDYKLAESCLTFSFERCHRRAVKNKRLILIYLLPVKMLLGYMPKMQLLQKYSLLQFADVARAVQQGNIKLLNEALATNEHFFIKCGIYLILEKLKTITYRNLIKKVALIMKTHQLPISSFTAAFHWLGETDVDDDEIQCILANLIYEDKIKGYISHQHQKLVVSKQNAFPPLSVKTVKV